MGVIIRYNNFLKTYKTRGHRIKHLIEYQKLFPIKASPLFAGIVGDLICDGHLQGDPKWRLDFTSKDNFELNYFNQRINKLFGVQGKIRDCKTNKFGKTFNIGINCSPIARIFFLCGVPIGQKVLKNFLIPDWIKNNKECFREFCKRAFTCEGTIMYESHRKFPQVRLDLWKKEGIKNNFIFELGRYLNRHFNIKSTIRIQNSFNERKDGTITKPTRIYILGESVLKFHKEIGFDGEKQEKLDKILGSQGFLPCSTGI